MPKTATPLGRGSLGTGKCLSVVRPHKEPPMYAGKPTEGLEFYRLLFKSDEFCAEMGRVALASSQLEAELIQLLLERNVPVKVEGLPLGALVKAARKHHVLEGNELSVLDDLCSQRNYLTHNIYALFIDLIEETRLERSNLVDSDVHTYTECARQLRENLVGLAEIVVQNIANNPARVHSAV
jgi:hypothetical protein